MSKELYIGGLPYSVSDGQLIEMFSSNGTVKSARVIKGRITRQSRGLRLCRYERTGRG